MIVFDSCSDTSDPRVMRASKLGQPTRHCAHASDAAAESRASSREHREGVVGDDCQYIVYAGTIT